jgi:hypothetical protein
MTTAVQARTVSPTWEDAWDAALRTLELDVAAAEALLSLDHIADAPPRPWAPPAGLGPLPVTMAERARLLLDRQIEAGRRLAEAADLSRRHLRAVHGMRATAPSVPVYLDTPA